MIKNIIFLFISQSAADGVDGKNEISHPLVYLFSILIFYKLYTKIISFFHFVFLVCRTNDPFRCRDPSKKCIDIDQTCDGYQDCEDGFDESEKDLGCVTKAPTEPEDGNATTTSVAAPTKSGPQTGEFYSSQSSLPFL